MNPTANLIGALRESLYANPGHGQECDFARYDPAGYDPADGPPLQCTCWRGMAEQEIAAAEASPTLEQQAAADLRTTQERDREACQRILSVLVRCPACGGDGLADPAWGISERTTRCEPCGGSGFVSVGDILLNRDELHEYGDHGNGWGQWLVDELRRKAGQ